MTTWRTWQRWHYAKNISQSDKSRLMLEFPGPAPAFPSEQFDCWCLKHDTVDSHSTYAGPSNSVTLGGANEWFARNRIPLLCAKNFGIARGQTLLVARGKCMAKSCFRVQKRDFGETSTLFRPSFIANGLGECWYVENVSFCLNNR